MQGKIMKTGLADVDCRPGWLQLLPAGVSGRMQKPQCYSWYSLGVATCLVDVRRPKKAQKEDNLEANHKIGHNTHNEPYQFLLAYATHWGLLHTLPGFLCVVGGAGIRSCGSGLLFCQFGLCGSRSCVVWFSLVLGSPICPCR